MAMEVANAEQLKVRLQELLEAAQEQVLLASQAMVRDDDHLKRAENMKAEITDRGFIQDHIDIVNELIEPCRKAAAASRTAHAAAVAKVNAVTAAIAMAQGHVEMGAEGAAGPVYQKSGAH